MLVPNCQREKDDEEEEEEEEGGGGGGGGNNNQSGKTAKCSPNTPDKEEKNAPEPHEEPTGFQESS